MSPHQLNLVGQASWEMEPSEGERFPPWLFGCLGRWQAQIAGQGRCGPYSRRKAHGVAKGWVVLSTDGS